MEIMVNLILAGWGEGDEDGGGGVKRDRNSGSVKDYRNRFSVFWSR